MGMPLATRAKQGTQTDVTAHVRGTTQSTIRQDTARIVNTGPGHITPQAQKSAQAGITMEVSATTKVAQLQNELAHSQELLSKAQTMVRTGISQMPFTGMETSRMGGVQIQNQTKRTQCLFNKGSSNDTKKSGSARS